MGGRDRHPEAIPLVCVPLAPVKLVNVTARVARHVVGIIAAIDRECALIFNRAGDIPRAE
jgi:hypothetical protein